MASSRRAPPVDSSSPIPITLSEKDLKQYLDRIHAMFQAAVEFSPALVVERIVPLNDVLPGRPRVYELETPAYDCWKSIDGALPSDTPDHIRECYKYNGLCGIFCWLTSDGLKQELSKYEVEVEWMVTKPIARTVLFFPGCNIQLEDHAALKFTLPSEDEYVADFTLPQFGYHNRPWWYEHADYKYFYAYCCRPEVRCERTPEQFEKDHVDWMASERYEGYWDKVKILFKEYFAKFSLEELMEMDMGELEREFRRAVSNIFL